MLVWRGRIKRTDATGVTSHTPRWLAPNVTIAAEASSRSTQRAAAPRLCASRGAGKVGRLSDVACRACWFVAVTLPMPQPLARHRARCEAPLATPGRCNRQDTSMKAQHSRASRSDRVADAGRFTWRVQRWAVRQMRHVYAGFSQPYQGAAASAATANAPGRAPLAIPGRRDRGGASMAGEASSRFSQVSRCGVPRCGGRAIPARSCDSRGVVKQN
jgi:hypothetical protein